MLLNKLGSSYDFDIIKLITQRSTVVQYSHFKFMAVNNLLAVTQRFSHHSSCYLLFSIPSVS